MDFEAGKGFRKTPKGQTVYLVGAILLHELTHWADDQDSVDDPPFEEGDAFTKDIYGALSRLPVGSCEPAKQGDERQPGGLLPDTPLPRPFFGGRDDPLKKRILTHGCAL